MTKGNPRKNADFKEWNTYWCRTYLSLYTNPVNNRRGGRDHVWTARDELFLRFKSDPEQERLKLRIDELTENIGKCKWGRKRAVLKEQQSKELQCLRNNRHVAQAFAYFKKQAYLDETNDGKLQATLKPVFDYLEQNNAVSARSTIPNMLVKITPEKADGFKDFLAIFLKEYNSKLFFSIDARMEPFPLAIIKYLQRCLLWGRALSIRYPDVQTFDKEASGRKAENSRSKAEVRKMFSSGELSKENFEDLIYTLNEERQAMRQNDRFERSLVLLGTKWAETAQVLLFIRKPFNSPTGSESIYALFDQQYLLPSMRTIDQRQSVWSYSKKYWDKHA